MTAHNNCVNYYRHVAIFSQWALKKQQLLYLVAPGFVKDPGVSPINTMHLLEKRVNEFTFYTLRSRDSKRANFLLFKSK